MIQEAWFKNAAGEQLFERRLPAEGETRANVVLLHGYGDHSGRYDWVMQQFHGEDMAVYAYDQRGHGRSPGRRAYIHRFEDFLDDLDVFLEHIQPDLAPAPLVILGHSMGGMVLARYAQTRDPDVRGLVFSSPFLAFSDTVPRFLVALGPYIARVLPGLPVGKVDNSGLSRDPAVIEAANNDPLAYHGGVAARTGAEFYRMINTIHEAFERITAPMLVLHGKADAIVGHGGSIRLHEKAGARDKTLRLYEDGFHELYNDLDKEQFMAEITTWIKARL